VFQCLLIDGENAGDAALRDAERFVITDDQFQTFVDRHRSVSCLVPESNTAMRYSYLILDEYVSYFDQISHLQCCFFLIQTLNEALSNNSNESGHSSIIFLV